MRTLPEINGPVLVPPIINPPRKIQKSIAHIHIIQEGYT